MLAWYARHGRDLPWRRTRDPYAILIAEILSHQTQIARVVPVYERLLARYPTAALLATAPLAEVKAITDPLGYKVRGGWLHAAALMVSEERAGYFPRSVAELRQLPGVGRYTAGAIMSFAHQLDAPIVDTNVARLLGRYFGVPSGGGTPGRRLWDLAAAVIPQGRGYLINQALMDLGAMVCLARKPRCVACPVSRGCLGRANLKLERSRQI